MGLETALVATAIGAQIGGGILKAKGAREQAESIAESAEYNKLLALRRGRIEQSILRRRNRRELSSERARIGGSGVRLEGSPLEFLGNLAGELERDVVEAGVSARLTADLETRRARVARREGKRQALSSVIATLGQVGQTAGGFF